MAIGLLVQTGDHSTRLKIGSASLPDETADEFCIRLMGARTGPRAKNQRRIPSRSINDL